MDQLRLRISEKVYEKLLNTNIDCLKTIIVLNNIEIQEKLKITHSEATFLLQETASILIQSKIKKDIPDWSKLLTGCESIDALTRGGLPANGITEIYGCSGVGKTQFCLQLSLMVQLSKTFGGMEKGAVYISTEDIFPSKRLHSLCCAFNKTYKNVPNFEDNIYLEHATDYEELRRILYVHLPKLLQRIPIGLLIIDSIAGAFRSEDTTDYVNRSEQFHEISVKLRELARIHDLIVICVNQVTDNVTTEKIEPSLGYAWKNLVTSRFEISRVSPESSIRTFEVINSPHLPSHSCNFILTNDGVKSVD